MSYKCCNCGYIEKDFTHTMPQDNCCQRCGSYAFVDLKKEKIVIFACYAFLEPSPFQNKRHGFNFIGKNDKKVKKKSRK